MGIKAYKPTSPGRRGMVVSDFSELTRRTSEKSLTVGKHSTGGRNNYGRMTVRFRGGGVKRCYRIIDFKRYDKDGVPAKVAESNTTPTAPAASRSCTTRTARSATSPRLSASSRATFL